MSTQIRGEQILDDSITSADIQNKTIRTEDLDRSLAFNIAENAYVEYIYTGNKVFQEKYWEDSNKTKLIRVKTYTYNENKVSIEEDVMYKNGQEIEKTIKNYYYNLNKIIYYTINYQKDQSQINSGGGEL